MVRKPVFAANWKMNHGPTDAKAFLRTFLVHYARRADRTVAFFPPAITLHAVTEALRDAGVEVHAVPDGVSAVRRCRELAPETVLLDLDMPVMDGFEAARLIRAAECTQRLVALTGRPTQDACSKAQAAGFDQVLSKPISAAMLMRALFPDASDTVRPSRPHA